jgi:hypothetical protein
MLSVESLRNPSKLKDAYAWFIEMLTSVGFETTGWQPGRIQLSMMTAFSAGTADLTELGKFIAEFGFNDLSSGPALTLYSKSRYDNDRFLATKTRGPMRLKNKSGSSHTLDVGKVIVSDAIGNEFRNVTGGTIAPGSTGSPSQLDLEFEALVAGAKSSNVARGTVTTMITPFAGVSVSNNVTSIDQPWYTTGGLDEELDAALRKRNSTKWALSSLILVREGFEAVALQNGAIKVDIDDTNPRGQGTLDVYAGGAAALLGSSTMQALQLAFSRRVFNTQATWLNPWPPGNPSLVQVKHPLTQELNLAGGTVYYSGELDAVRESVRQALLDLVILAPIGGYSYPPGPSNVVTIGDLSASIEESSGVETIELGLAADIAVASRHLLVPPADPYFGLAFVAVTG